MKDISFGTNTLDDSVPLSDRNITSAVSQLREDVSVRAQSNFDRLVAEKFPTVL